MKQIQHLPTMFARDKILCSNGNNANFFCIGENCEESPFVCNEDCNCKKKHSTFCSLKNIPKLANEVESLLKRNFSKTLKGQGIEVVGRVAKQTVAGPKNARFCLTICEVKSKTSIEFFVKTLKTCVGVGIFHKPTITKNLYQYIPDAQYINHGSYMLLSNGFKYSHTSTQQNFQEVSKISLEQGNRIKLQYNEGILKFVQEANQAELQVPETLKDLWFGVYLYDEGDEMEVLVKE